MTTETQWGSLAADQRWSVQQGDAVAALYTLPRSSVDCVVTDYAYESLERHRARGTTTRLAKSAKSSNPWFGIFRNERIPDLLTAIRYVLRPARHAWMVCDDETADLIKACAPGAGLYCWGALTWLKTKPSVPPGEWGPPWIGMGYHGRRCTERLVLLERRSTDAPISPVGIVTDLAGPRIVGRGHPPAEGRRLNDLGMPEVVPCPPVRGKGAYPTEKPVWLLRRLIEQSTQPGEVVVDPFCGSGSTGEAALRSGRRVQLFDLAADAVGLARTRLEGVDHVG